MLLERMAAVADDGDDVIGEDWDEPVPHLPRAVSREFEDVDLRRHEMLTYNTPMQQPAASVDDVTSSARERMRSRAGHLISRTRSFAPARRSRSGVIDENAVPDPDVILLADAVLASRPTLSPPVTPRKEGDAPEAGSRPITNYLRIGRSHVRAARAPNSAEASRERDASADAPPNMAYAGAGRGCEMLYAQSRSGRRTSLPAFASTAPGRTHSLDTSLEQHLTIQSSSGGASHPCGATGGCGAVPGCPSSQVSSVCGSHPSSEQSTLRRRIEQLSGQLAATEAELRSAQVQSSHWQHCVHDLFNGLLLNPRMNAKYEVKVRARRLHVMHGGPNPYGAASHPPPF